MDGIVARNEVEVDGSVAGVGAFFGLVDNDGDGGRAVIDRFTVTIDDVNGRRGSHEWTDVDIGAVGMKAARSDDGTICEGDIAALHVHRSRRVDRAGLA